MSDLKTFTAACIAALYFTDTGGGDQPDPEAELSPDTRAALEAECLSFWRRFGPYVNAATCKRYIGRDSPAAQAGHDFWLTRNGHGAGFWDGDWSEPYGDILTRGAKCYGEFDTYLGDDGLIYV